MVAAPHFYVEPNVVINTTEVQCHLQMVTLIPEVVWGDVETYCNPGGEAVQRVSWRGVMRVRMSYGTDSAWAFFSALDPAVAQDLVIYPADPGTGGGDGGESVGDDGGVHRCPAVHPRS